MAEAQEQGRRASFGLPALVVGALALGQFLVSLDSSVATVALPEIQDEFDSDSAQLQWIVIAYLLAGAAFALPIGATGDRLGRKRIYVAGAAVFGLGSAASALAPSMDLLIVARFIQGAGAAALTALALAILTAAAQRDQVARVVGTWTAVATAAAAAGPLVGGLLVDSFGWRAVFAVNIPIAIILVVVAQRELAEQRVEGRTGIGWVGAGLLAVALMLIALGLSSTESHGLLSTIPLVLLGLGSLALLAAAFQQRRTDTPLLDWAGLRRAPIPIALVLSLLLGMTLAGAFYELTIVLQSVLGFSATMTGVILMAASLALIVASPLAGRAVGQFGAAPVASVGLLVAACGMILLSSIAQDTSAFVLASQLVVLGAGIGIAFPPVNGSAMSAAGRDASGGAAGALAMSAQVAAILGVAIIGGLATARIGAQWQEDAGSDPALVALRSDVIIGDIGDVQSAAGAQAGDEAAQAFLDGVSEAFLVGAGGLAVASLVAAAGLRRRPTHPPMPRGLDDSATDSVGGNVDSA